MQGYVSNSVIFVCRQGVFETATSFNMNYDPGMGRSFTTLKIMVRMINRKSIGFIPF